MRTGGPKPWETRPVHAEAPEAAEQHVDRRWQIEYRLGSWRSAHRRIRCEPPRVRTIPYPFHLIENQRGVMSKGGYEADEGRTAKIGNRATAGGNKS